MAAVMTRTERALAAAERLLDVMGWGRDADDTIHLTAALAKFAEAECADLREQLRACEAALRDCIDEGGGRE